MARRNRINFIYDQDLIDFLNNEGFDGQINESLFDFLRSQGQNSSLNEMLYDYLDLLGFPGSVQEKFRLWKIATNQFTTPLGGNPNAVTDQGVEVFHNGELVVCSS